MPPAMNKHYAAARAALPFLGLALGASLAALVVTARAQDATPGAQQPPPPQQDQQAYEGPTDANMPMQPGEAFVTRFSGVAIGTNPDDPQAATIDVNGAVGVIIDTRAPQEPAQGQHWLNKPMRIAVTAMQVGQVFGVALDDQNPPNVYLTATAAFGLHLSAGGWMPGMWGANGGPGTVYRLDASRGYNAEPFAEIRLNGRENTGAALGNIAFDRKNRQFFVSDLETGLIHRLGQSGQDLGSFDHGMVARTSFFDVEAGQQKSINAIGFDPSSQPNFNNCPGTYERTPECWNLAASGRRVWGIGVRRDPMGENARLYYAVGSSPAYGNTTWASLSEEEKRNSVWSVAITARGAFDPSDVRREFILPDFFVAPADIERAGYSHPVSDISFSECGERPVMLVSERGGMRNRGLTADHAFATPSESRALRYELDRNGAWRAVGRYDVGNDDRKTSGSPYIRANCAGGAAFAPAPNAQANPAGQSGENAYVWITGDNLCSPEAPCRLPQATIPAPQPAAAAGEQPGSSEPEADPSHVHGIQGQSADNIVELAPAAAYQTYPAQGQPTPGNALDTS